MPVAARSDTETVWLRGREVCCSATHLLHDAHPLPSSYKCRLLTVPCSTSQLSVEEDVALTSIRDFRRQVRHLVSLRFTPAEDWRECVLPCC